LQWDFPGQAVAVPDEVFFQEDFQQGLSAFLEQASLESIKQFAAITHKACAPLPEIRDTANPTLITGALMTILEVNGATHTTPLLRKRVRDTVSFNQAHKPWRRSAFYLVLRVAMQRHLYKLLGVDKGRIYFKIILSIFMATLLDDGLHIISDESSHNLRQKLGRRLAKMELDQERGLDKVRQLHSHVFRSLRPIMTKSITSAGHYIQSEWEAHNRRTSRKIGHIQQYADPSDVVLDLPLSGQALRRIREPRFDTTHTEILSHEELLGRYESTAASRPYTAIRNRHLALCDYEENVSDTVRTANAAKGPESCIQLALHIDAYISTISDAYVDYSELKSRQILKVMELWQAMDECAVMCYPLLNKFHPGFEASMFDVLELSTLEELNRLHVVQTYVAKRCRAWCGRGSKTIFDPPADDSYAVRHYDDSVDSEMLQQHREDIQNHAAQLLAAKEEEWQSKSEDHESKIQQMAGLSCPYETVLDENGYAKQVHKKGCYKHRLKWEARQMSIGIHEHPLPNDEAALKAVVFELLCPEAFAAYRDATWCVISFFACPGGSPVKEVSLLREYSGLSDFVDSTASRITLGSPTKSHLNSHYATSRFPTPFREINRPLGLKLKYFDSTASTWTFSVDFPSLVHLFPMKLATNSPYDVFSALSTGWPTSNKTLATQTKCPPELNTHEYMAWQGLLLGTHARWPTLLRELGSTNLNFSTDATWAIVSRLCLQVGPVTSHDCLRDTQAVFHDVTFCDKMLEQADYRLEAVRRNWREPVQLDILLTILLKIHSLNPHPKIRAGAMALLEKARDISEQWSADLKLSGHDQGQGPSVFAIWAAVVQAHLLPSIRQRHQLFSSGHKEVHSRLYRTPGLPSRRFRCLAS
jgi:hypothetical protein